MNIDIEKQSTRFLCLLLLTDFLFIVIHLFYMMDLLPTVFFSDLPGSLFSVEKDFGYSEVYQYIKEYWIVILLVILSVKNRQIIYVLWSSLFLYFLLDDSLRIHEKLGRHIGQFFGFQPVFQLRVRDMGELCVFMVIAILLFAILGISYCWGDRVAKQRSLRLFVCVIILGFFGVFIDTLHMVISWGKPIWGLIEDGGEMLVMSIVLYYVFNMTTDISNKKPG